MWSEFYFTPNHRLFFHFSILHSCIYLKNNNTKSTQRKCLNIFFYTFNKCLFSVNINNNKKIHWVILSKIFVKLKQCNDGCSKKNHIARMKMLKCLTFYPVKSFVIIDFITVFVDWVGWKEKQNKSINIMKRSTLLQLLFHFSFFVFQKEKLKFDLLYS